MGPPTSAQKSATVVNYRDLPYRGGFTPTTRSRCECFPLPLLLAKQAPYGCEPSSYRRSSHQ